MRLRAFAVSLAIMLVGTTLDSTYVYAADAMAEAKQLFQKGREAFDRQDFPAALELFRKSQQLHPTPGTLLNLALAEAELGKVLSAEQHLQETIALLPPKDERIEFAKEQLAAVERRIPHLQILVCSAPTGLRVMRDDDVVAGDRLGAELPVEPGAHAIVVSAPGRPDRQYKINVEEGKRHTIAVEAGEAPAPSIVTGPTAPSIVPPAPSSIGARRTAGFIVAGLGLTSLGIGATTGLLSAGVKKDVDEVCPNPVVCSAAGVKLEDTGKTLATVSTVSLVVGGAALGAGVFLAASGGRDSGPKTSVVFVPMVLPAGAGIGAVGRF